MPELLDIFYTVLHLVIIVFNVTGWILPRTRKLHLWFVATTCFCWVILGIWYGFGYCPVTEWQWEVKEQLGEHDLPASFITYMLNNVFGLHVPESAVITGTGVVFLIVILITIYVNFVGRLRKGHDPF
jgi:hypothetical protein